VPAWRRPRPMWCSRLLCRRVMTPLRSMRSWRDPVVAGVDRGAGGHGFWAGGVGLDGCAPPEGAVGSDGVVVATELVEQSLELAEGGRAGLPVEPFLHGLVGTLDFPAGLRW
jgi:hypothetical protein